MCLCLLNMFIRHIHKNIYKDSVCILKHTNVTEYIPLKKTCHIKCAKCEFNVYDHLHHVFVFHKFHGLLLQYHFHLFDN